MADRITRVGLETSSDVPVNPATDESVKAVAGFVTTPYDYVAYASGVTTDTFTYKTGGAGGTTVATVTVNYTGVDKTVLSNVTKT